MGVGLTESGEHKTMCRQEMERKTNMGLLKNVKKKKFKKKHRNRKNEQGDNKTTNKTRETKQEREIVKKMKTGLCNSGNGSKLNTTIRTI